MKTIKNISMIAVLAFAGLSSCSKDTATDPLLVDNSFTQPSALAGTTALADTKVMPTALPQIILDYVATNYPNAAITKSEIEDNGNYEVKLNNGTELIFGADGAFLGIDDDTNEDFDDSVVDLATLPQSIPDYVAANHTGLTITHAEMENNGHYEVKLSDGTELVFDGNGGFLGIGVDDNEGSDHDGESGDNHDSSTVIDAATLPQTVKDYIATNYPSAAISNAKLKSNGQYEVYLSTGPELYFDAQGVFLGLDNDSEDQNGNEHEDGTVIDAATLPQLAKDYLSTTYPAASIIEARSMVNGGFEVELSTGIEVIFDANGNFVKTEDDSTENGD